MSKGLTAKPPPERQMSLDLRLGDCLDVLPDVPDGSVDMVLTDLPYGVLSKQNDASAWDCEIPLEPLWRNLLRIAKPQAAIVLFAQGMFTAKLMMSQPKLWRYNLIWDKVRASGFLNANRMPLRSHEDICVFYRNLPEYHPIMTKGVRKVSSASSKRNCMKTPNYGDHKPMDYDSAVRRCSPRRSPF